MTSSNPSGPAPGGLPDINAETYPAEQVLQALNRAACFQLYARSPGSQSPAARPDAVDLELDLHPFASNFLPTGGARGETAPAVASYRSRWLLSAANVPWRPGRAPEAGQDFDPRVEQGLVLYGDLLRFGDSNRHGFSGYGIGRTFPAVHEAADRVAVAAVGNLTQGFGKFSGLQGTYVFNGELSRRHGFRGSLMVRVADPRGLFAAAEPPRSGGAVALELDADYGVLSGRKRSLRDRSEVESPAGDSSMVLLSTVAELCPARCDVADGPGGLFVGSETGPEVTMIEARIAVDLAAPPGTAESPNPFTTRNRYSFRDRDGREVGTLEADLPLGLTFGLTFPELPGQPGLRLGGAGEIVAGSGIFEGVRGVVSVNSAIGIAPHVLALQQVIRCLPRDASRSANPDRERPRPVPRRPGLMPFPGGLASVLLSSARCSWALSLLGARTAARLLGLRPPLDLAQLDAWNRASEEALDDPFRELYEAAASLQDRVVDPVIDAVFSIADPGRWLGGAPKEAFDATRFVVLGDGLSAGLGHVSLEASFQATSFPALVADALGVIFRQPLMQPPGLGDVVGLDPRPPVVPEVRQSTVLDAGLPQEADLGNLSVPGFDLDDAVERRACAPLVDRDSSLQTLANFILGLPDLEYGPDGPSQIEYARRRAPTLVLVCFGYDEILAAAVAGVAARLPDGNGFERRLERLLEGLPGAATVVLTTVPDPFHSAYFSTPERAAEILKTTPGFLAEHWGVRPTDRVTLRGLWAMGYQTMARDVGPLAQSPLVGASLLSAVAESVSAVNGAISRVARATDAHVFDLHGLLADVAGRGLDLPQRSLGAGYLGGLYLLNGAYPGPTLNAEIADRMLRWLGETYGVRCRGVDVAAVADRDGNTRTELAPGPVATDAFLRPRTEDEIPRIRNAAEPVETVPIQTTYPSRQLAKARCTPVVGTPAGGLADPSYADPEFRPLDIPPDGLDYTLEVNGEVSCFGDALRVVDCPGEAPVVPGFPPFGLCERTLFGGFLPTSSPLSGRVRVRISPPDSDGRARFEIRHPGGLSGGPGDLSGPILFRMPVQHSQVRDLPGAVSSGVLDTRTGAVYDFHYNLQNMNTALYSLLQLNPNLPPPLLSTQLTFPGQPNGGSSWAQFTPRDDGLFDVSLAAHLFVPLGSGTDDEPLRFALPFTTPDLRAATCLSRGTSLHPRIFVTTRPSPSAPSGPVFSGGGGSSSASSAGDLPYDSVVEFCAFTRDTYFGDAFDLHAPELGVGSATGRTHLMARVRVQFGSPTDSTVPVVLQVLPPGGLLGAAPVPPPFVPGVSRGAAGFDTELHFPRLTYAQSGLSSPDDPFNVCSTSVHLASGETVGPLLWRGFVVQELFAALLMVEPCTPADSFNYQGPARFARNPGGGWVLHWNGTVFVPYPQGFAFPSPTSDGRPAIRIEGDSRLDPFRAVRAGSRVALSDEVLEGEVERATSPATGAEFSYRWSIPSDPKRGREARFEYANHTHGGRFELTALSWLDVARSSDAGGAGGADTVTFGGFGTWSEDPGRLHQVSVQISTAVDAPYVGIQVDGGVTSNADVRPERPPRA